MFIPVGTNSQAIWQVDKDENGKVTKTQLFDVMVRLVALSIPIYAHAPLQYVPLTDRKPKASSWLYWLASKAELELASADFLKYPDSSAKLWKEQMYS